MGDLILYDCLVYEPDVAVVSFQEAKAPQCAFHKASLVSRWIPKPIAKLLGYRSEDDEDKEHDDKSHVDWGIVASAGHEVIALLQRKPTHQELHFRFRGSAFVRVHEEVVPTYPSPSTALLLAITDEGSYCAVWDGQLWIYQIKNVSTDPHADPEAFKEGVESEAQAPTVRLKFTHSLSRQCLTGHVPLMPFGRDEGTKESRRHFMAKTLLAGDASVLQIGFYRPDASGPWQLLVLLEDGACVYCLGLDNKPGSPNPRLSPTRPKALAGLSSLGFASSTTQQSVPVTSAADQLPAFNVSGLVAPAAPPDGTPQTPPVCRITTFATHSEERVAVLAVAESAAGDTSTITKMTFSESGMYRVQSRCCHK